MFRLLSTTSRIALVAAAAFAVSPMAAMAADTTVPADTTVTTQVTVSGTDHLIVNSGGVLTSGSSPTVTYGVSASPGVVIDNYGTIQSTNSGGRAIASTGSGAHNLTLNNYEGALITSVNDAFQLGSNLNGGIVTINNDGTITSTSTGQALDFNNASNGTVNINNNATGIISASAAYDVIRPGSNATVENAGIIQSYADTDTAYGGDAIDFQDGGGRVDNLGSGLIEGSRHGITGELGITVTNAVDATIRGRNGSGINIDNSLTSTLIVTNYGLISGEAQDTTSFDSDGDGIDADGLAQIDNYGTIQGLGASGTHNGQANTSEAIAIGGGTINNYAGGIIYSVDTAIQIDDSDLGPALAAATVYNEGQIIGDGGTAINILGTFNDTITNEGQIVGDIFLDGGSDTLNLYTGQSIDGNANGGTGIDTVNLYAGAGAGGSAGNISNFEVLQVLSGDWTLTSDESFANGATISGGASLASDYDIIGKVTVLPNARFSGNATVTQLVASGGPAGDPTVAPGGDGIGTMTVQTQASLTQMNLEIDANAAGESDELVVDGDAYVRDVNVVVTATPGAYEASTTYTIIHAGTLYDDGGNTATDNLAFLDASLSSDDQNLYLTLFRNDIALWDVAETANQNAVAHAVGEYAPSTLYDEIVTLSAEQTRSAYDSLSGEIHASVGGVLAAQSNLVTDSLLSRFQVAFGEDPAPVAPLGYADEKKTDTAAFDSLQPAGPRYAGWAQAFGQKLSASGDGNAAGVDSRLGGVLAGFDVTTGNLMFGFAAGYAATRSDVEERESSADTSTGLVAAYAGVDLDYAQLRGGASYGSSQIDTVRTATVGSITEHPEASYEGRFANAFVEVAHATHLGGFAVEPFAGAAWTGVELDGFTETNAPTTGLTSDGQSYATVSTTLGVRVASAIPLGGTVFRPHGMVGWRHAFGDITPEMAMSFTDTGADFVVAGLPIARDSAVVEAGLGWAFSSMNFDLTYSGAIAADSSSHALKATAYVKF